MQSIQFQLASINHAANCLTKGFSNVRGMNFSPIIKSTAYAFFLLLRKILKIMKKTSLIPVSPKKSDKDRGRFKLTFYWPREREIGHQTLRNFPKFHYPRT